MTEVKRIPAGYHTITQVLAVNYGLKAIEYYKKVFGAIDKGIMMKSDGKSVAHAELMIGDSKIMLSDGFPEMKCLSPESIGKSPVSLHLYVEDVDRTFNLAVLEGGKSLFPVKDQFYGDGHGGTQDPFGHIWTLATPIKDLTKEEMKKAAEETFSKKAK